MSATVPSSGTGSIDGGQNSSSNLGSSGGTTSTNITDENVQEIGCNSAIVTKCTGEQRLYICREDGVYKSVKNNPAMLQKTVTIHIPRHKMTAPFMISTWAVRFIESGSLVPLRTLLRAPHCYLHQHNIFRRLRAQVALQQSLIRSADGTPCFTMGMDTSSPLKIPTKDARPSCTAQVAFSSQLRHPNFARPSICIMATIEFTQNRS